MVTTSGSATPRPALTDLWYAAELSDVCVSLDSLLAHRAWLRALCTRSSVIRACALFWLGRGYPVILTKFHPISGMVLPVLETLAGRRRLVFLEFITRLESRSTNRLRARVITGLYLRYIRFLVAPVLRRVLKRAQVMTAWEGEAYARAYDIPADRFRLIPWSLNQGEWEARDLDRDDEPLRVVSSGRAACDWDTLFRAAQGASWPLTVICGRSERATVDRLNHDGRATVRSEVSLADHADAIRGATVYVLCLLDVGASSGQIRLGNCNEIGTPVVASRVKGLAPYIVEGVNAVTVAVGDATALRREIDRLIASPERRRALARSARAHSLSFTRDEQMRLIADLVREAL